MELLRELMELQEQHGFLGDDVLRSLSAERHVPLFRLEGLVSFYPHFRRTPPPRVTVQVCRDITCAMAGAAPGCSRLRDRCDGEDVEIVEVSCLGRCDAAPALAINDEPCTPVTLRDDDQVDASIRDAKPIRSDDESRPRRKCDPYPSAKDRYGTILKLAQNRTELRTHCVDRLKASGLSGMGGAGFPTGVKWDLVANEQADVKYVICNADESEPGTFKDRNILRELPHLVIEGMALAALTVGATRGIVYLRHEYESEGQALQAALDEARQRGIIGDNAARSGQPFEIEIFISPGGYILGEETALLEALEDKRGEPRNKPPYPGQHGLWGKPTLINNVETFALATSIVHHGPDWWDDQGADGFRGLKFVSVSGDVQTPGVYEIPIGITVRELIEIAGGMKAGTTLQAFLPGGASSMFLTAADADTPLDFESMKQAGSMLGTGAVIVIGDQHNLLELATNVVTFFRNESCGKCVPCRLGTEKAVRLLDGLGESDPPAQSIELLRDLGSTLEQTSICGLGQVALNPVLSMLERFPDQVPS